MDFYFDKRLFLFAATMILFFCNSSKANVLIDGALIFTTYNLYKIDKKDNKKFDCYFWAILFSCSILVFIIKVLLFFIN